MRWQKGSFTIEGSILVPFFLFMIMMVLETAIGFYQESSERKVSRELQEIDLVAEFYNYQMLKEIGGELFHD